MIDLDKPYTPNKFCKDCIKECKQHNEVEVVKCPIKELKRGRKSKIN